VDERAASGGLPSDDPAPVSADGRHGATGQHRDDPASRAPARGSPNALKNWKVRSRLLLLVIIPVLAATTLGGIRIASSAQSAFAYQRVVQLANLNGKIIGLEQALQKERQDTITFIALGANGGRAAPRSPSSRLQLTVLSHGDYAVSSRWAAQVKSLLGDIGSGYSELTQQDARAAAAAIDGLWPLRTAATRSRLPALVVIRDYADKKYGFAAKKAEIVTAKQKEHDDKIAKDTEARIRKEYAEAGGNNPMVRQGVTSQFDKVKAAVSAGTRKDPLSLNAEQRRAQTRQSIQQELTDNAAATVN